MKRAVQIGVFVTLALGLHGLAVVIWTATSDGGAQSGGASGESLVSIEGATPQLAALVESWQAPPVSPEAARAPNLTAPAPVQPRARAPELPRPELAALPPVPLPPVAPASAQRDQPPAPMALPVMAPTLSQAPSLPQPAAPEESRTESLAPPPMADQAPSLPREQAMPAAPAAPTPPASSLQTDPQSGPAPKARPASAGVAAQRAAGSGGGPQAGERNTSQAATLSAGERQSLMANWGATLRAKIERRKRFPVTRTRVRHGRVILKLRVRRDGALLGVAIQKSSGDAALDTAALDAVKRAAPFAAAPKALPGPSFLFSLPVSFRR
ncbi:TonB family protein [Pseudodonghicola xiamenensis]|uniref:TonB C-terminal domain-containing protein n=1 Tax=Pseudodonghicola xiamenensis TaxID=337702 RepID=A0A8J3H561_9RHOB|nr:TonB family protein [Pseudodonghicola xiamenensis]GHG81396.1 hypothetical protein GCM10010961_05400 [Pseudodonghicola xiamenensis]